MAKKTSKKKTAKKAASSVPDKKEFIAYLKVVGDEDIYRATTYAGINLAEKHPEFAELRGKLMKAAIKVDDWIKRTTSQLQLG